MVYNNKADAISSWKMHYAERLHKHFQAVKATYNGEWTGKWCVVFNPNC